MFSKKSNYVIYLLLNFQKTLKIIKFEENSKIKS